MESKAAVSSPSTTKPSAGQAVSVTLMLLAALQGSDGEEDTATVNCCGQDNSEHAQASGSSRLGTAI